MRTLMDATDELKQAFRTAASDIKDAVGMEKDPDVALYDRMTERDIARMADAYGLDNTIDYIQDMAFRKATRGK